MIESLDVVVHGHPRPQGSMISLGRGRPVVASNREVLHPWRDAITAEVMKRTGGKLLWSRGVALRADLVFVLPQPASSRYPEPSGRVGDLDKLVRAALDAVTASRAWQDDSQVLELTARKCYPAADPGGLGTPGLRLRITLASRPSGQHAQMELVI